MTESTSQFANYAFSEVIETVSVSGNTSAFESRGYACLSFTADIDAISGSSASIQFMIEMSDDAINWFHLHDTPRMTTTSVANIQSIRLASRFYRYRWVVSGTTPSILFTISTTLKDYFPTPSGSMKRYNDLNLKTINSVSSIYDADSTSSVSIQIVRPNDLLDTAVVRIEVSYDGVNWDPLSSDFNLVTNTNLSMTFPGQSYRFYRLKTVSPALLIGAGTAHAFWSSSGGG